jgi:hypothetical protein
MESNMSFITRRRFVKQTAFVAGALYARPMKSLAETRSIFGGQKDSAAPLDAAAIRKLASNDHWPCDHTGWAGYESARLVGNRAYDRHPALIVLCAGAADVTRTLDFAQSQSLPIAIHCPAPVETPRALFTIS